MAPQIQPKVILGQGASDKPWELFNVQPPQKKTMYKIVMEDLWAHFCGECDINLYMEHKC